MVGEPPPRPRPTISPELSVYLDLVRFLAAVAVAVGHAAFDGLYVGDPSLAEFRHDAVIVFFVLSGLVIATTASRPDETLRSYAIARISRLYSVVVPAIAFSYLVALVAILLGADPRNWFSAPEEPAATALSSLLFLNESWFNGLNLPWNDPYWSLCYEAWYYVLFGAFFFLQGRQRWVFLAVGAAFAGPRILTLFPIWLLGVLVALTIRKCPRDVPLGWAMVAASSVGIVTLAGSGADSELREYLHDAIPGWWRLDASQRVATDLILGCCVAANFIGFHMAGGSVSGALARLRTPIVFFASFTFSIYLFHRPMTQFAAFLDLTGGESLAAFCLVVGAVIATCMLLGEFTERRLPAVRRWTAWLFDRLAPPLARQVPVAG